MAGPAPDAAPLLKLARAIVDHVDDKRREGATAPPPAPGRRVALAFWRPGGEPLVATVSGAAGTLADAVARAAEIIASKVPDAGGAQVGRLGSKEREHQDLGSQAFEQDGLLVPAPVGRDSHRETV